MESIINEGAVSQNMFLGTILENSYIPVLLKDYNDSNGSFNLPPEILAGAFKLENNIAATAISSGIVWNQWQGTSLIQLLWELVKDFLSYFTRRKKLNEIKRTFNDFITKSKDCFDDYKTRHEGSLQILVDYTGKLNTSKTLMKKYLLFKLFKQLQNMGIPGNYTEFEEEYIDLRNFPINQNYDLVKTQQLKFEEIADTTLGNIVELVNVIRPWNLLFLRFLNNHEIKKIQQKLKELQKIQEYNEAQMNSDLIKLGILEAALKNVSAIYSDLLNVLMPIMEKLLAELTYKYDDDFSNMSTEKIEVIRRIKDILKDLSEVKVVPNRASDKIVSSIVKYSNDLSIRQYELKRQILKMVG